MDSYGNMVKMKIYFCQNWLAIKKVGYVSEILYYLLFDHVVVFYYLGQNKFSY